MIQLYILFTCIDLLFFHCYCFLLFVYIFLVNLSPYHTLPFLKFCIKFCIFFYLHFNFASHLSSAIFIVSLVNYFVTFLFFTFGIHFSAVFITASSISIHKSSGFLPSTCSIMNLFLTSTVVFVVNFLGHILE